MAASSCKFEKGIDSHSIGNMEGEVLSDEEGLKFKITDLPCEQYQYLVDKLKSTFHANVKSKQSVKDVENQLANLKKSPGFLAANCAPIISEVDLANLIKSLPQ
jgi:hypothetical protein